MNQAYNFLGMKNFPPYLILLIIIPAAICLYLYSAHFQVAGLYGDDGIYIVTAKALHQDSGYRIASLPGSPLQTHYPPLFPLGLSLCWHINASFPENIHLMRLFSASCAIFVLFLSYIYIRVKSERNFAIILLFLIAMAFNPWFVLYSGQIMSEMLFTLLSLTSIIFFIRYDQGKGKAGLYFSLLFAALAIYTRSIGIALFASYFFWYLWRRRFKASLGILGFTILICIPWIYWICNSSAPADGVTAGTISHSYFEGLIPSVIQHIKHLPFAISTRIMSIPSLLCAFPKITEMPSGLNYLFVLIFSFIVWFFLVTGIVYELRKSPSVETFYLAITLVILILFRTWTQERYFVPLLPFILFHLLRGIKAVREDILSFPSYHRIAKSLWIAGVAVLFIGIPVMGNLCSAWPFVREHPANGEGSFLVVERACDWIRHNTKKEDVIASQFYDPVIYLLSERKGVGADIRNYSARYIDKPELLYNEAQILQRIRRHHADYLLLLGTDMKEVNKFTVFNGEIDKIFNRYPETFRLVYDDEKNFAIYKVTGS